MAITPKEAREAILQHGGIRAAARAIGVDHASLCRISKRPDAAPAKEPKPAPERKAPEPKKAEDSGDLPAINLSPATRIVDRRPAVTVRSKFYTLPKGKAFRVPDLCKRWGFSAETLKRHARDEGCFAYVDTTGHDDFEECILHPETAASRLKGN